MAVRIINPDPSPEVVKQVVCRNCGVTLEYTPFDRRKVTQKDIDGGTDVYNVVDCPKCSKALRVT